MANPYGQPVPVTDAPVGSVPLDQPLYGATFGQAISRFWRKYATFTGRASRSEYWWAMLFYQGSLMALMLPFYIWFFVTIDGGTGVPRLGPLLGLLVISMVSLVAFVPLLSVTWRRLQDAGHAGALALVMFVPAGNIVVWVLCAQPSSPRGMQFEPRGWGPYTALPPGAMWSYGPYTTPSPYGAPGPAGGTPPVVWDAPSDDQR